MSLIYITGLSGSGKSTVCSELKRMGIEAHDADGEGINSWYKTSSGKIASREEIDKPHTDDWYKKFSWQTSEKKKANRKNFRFWAQDQNRRLYF